MIELRPTDLRQYEYCPRVVFYDHCTPFRRRETAKMAYGKDAHHLERLLEKRRSLRRYDLHQGRRDFDVKLVSESLNLSGSCDLAVITSDAVYPVEFKMTKRKPSKGHELQMCAYALLLEEHYMLPCPQGFWHSIGTGYTFVVPFGDALRLKTLRAIQTISTFIKDETMPPPTPRRSKCVDCELKNFCGDVV